MFKWWQSSCIDTGLISPDPLHLQTILNKTKVTQVLPRAISVLPRYRSSPPSLRSAIPPAAVSDIPEECVLVGTRYARIFIFSNHLLTILHTMYLVSNKVTSNYIGQNHRFLTYIAQLSMYMPPFIAKIWTSQNCLAWMMEKSVKYLPNRSE